MGGQSGAPIILIEPEGLMVIGIHKGGNLMERNLVLNIGRLITPNLISILKK